MLKNLHSLIASTILLLTACSSVPVQEAGQPLPPQGDQQAVEHLQGLNQQFLQGKTLFLANKYEEAARLLLPLAQQGHLDAQYSVGYMYHYGYGLPRNEKEATRWITTAAARGHQKAQQALLLLEEYYGQP